MKPVALVERAIRNSSKSRDIVLDPFGGSGTTLDPKYADVIVQRWQQSTGRQAHLAETKQAFGVPAATQASRNANEAALTDLPKASC